MSDCKTNYLYRLPWNVTEKEKIQIIDSVKFNMIFSLKETTLCVIFFPTMILSLALNAVIFAIIFQERRLRRARFYVIANLAVADSITLLLNLVTIIQSLAVGSTGSNILNISIVATKTLSTAAHKNSFFTTEFLAIDRFLAVKYDIYYYTILK